jgi:hypothetical protein
MTKKALNRPMTLVATVAATAGIATAAWAAGAEPASTARPAATVVADLHAPDAAVERAMAAAAAQTGLTPSDVRIQRVGGPLEATAAVAELASTHAAAIAGVGNDARAAIGQAQGAELSPETAWLTVR